jgi:hypothetical protein
MLADLVRWHELVELRIPLGLCLTGYATESDVGDGYVGAVDTYGRTDGATGHRQRTAQHAEDSSLSILHLPPTPPSAKALWVTRLDLPVEELAVAPDRAGRDLADLVRFVSASH